MTSAAQTIPEMTSPPVVDSPTGMRWGLATAIANDDPVLVLTQLARCSEVKARDLAAERESVLNLMEQMDNDTEQQQQQQQQQTSEVLKINQIDQSLHHHFTKHAKAHFKTIALIIAATFNCLEVMSELLKDIHSTQVDPSYHNQEAFVNACKNGHLDVVNVLMADRRVDPSVWHNSAILGAAKNGHCKIVRMLALDERVNPGKHLRYIFEMSCWVGDTETAEQVLQDSAIDPSANDSQGFVQACAFGRDSIVQLMLSDGRIDPSCWNSRFSNAPLEIAVEKGHSKVVRLLLQNERVNPGLNQEFAFNKYCLAGDAESVQRMLEDGDVDPLTDDNLIMASKFGRASVVQVLLNDPRFDPSFDDCYALKAATFRGHIKVVKLLLADPRVDPSVEAQQPLKNAVVCGHFAIVQFLLADPRVDPSADENWALIRATQNGRSALPIVKLLLADSRVDPAAEDNTPVRAASVNGADCVVELLMADPRVDPSVEDNEALKQACEFGHHTVLKALLRDPRVDPSVEDNLAIKDACQNGESEVVQVLLADSRVNPAAEDNYAIRQACSMCAAYVRPGFSNAQLIKKYVDIVGHLLNDPRVNPSAGEPSAIEVASKSGCVDLFEILLTHPRSVVTKLALMFADGGRHAQAVDQLVAQQPQVLLTLFEGEVVCTPDGPLCSLLNQWEKRSAFVLLLAVKRTQTAQVAARLNDVLRETIDKFAPFQVVLTGR